jgi:16S rRNA (cytidine1402-2'-O)-methyltransferase
VSGGGRGELVVIATPIGNLGDFTERAKTLIGTADLLCCEDTRTTGRLLSLVGASAAKLISVHEHNEHERIPYLVDRLVGGARVGLVCDAGTPLLSDPGARLVTAAIGVGVVVTAAPGASAVLAALVVSGLGGGRFRFEGFLPKKGRDRADRLAVIAGALEPTVLYEAPSRVVATLSDLLDSCGPDRAVAVSRELTKLHEQTWRGLLIDAAASSVATAARGEYVLVVDGHTQAKESGPDLGELVARLAAAGLGRRDAVASLEILLEVNHRAAYNAALANGGFTKEP